MSALIVVALCLGMLYLLSQGAPYVPTRKQDAQTALRLMDLKDGAMVVDIGAGDGIILKTAAKKGFRAVGIELNPLLWMVAELRTRRFKNKVEVIQGNAWHWHLPDETAGVFLFTAGPFAKRMAAWLQTEQKRMGRPITVVSLGFQLLGHTPVKTEEGCILYRLG